MADNPSAIEHVKSIVKLKHGAPGLQAATLKTIAQLYFEAEDFEQLLIYIEQLEALPSSGNDVLMFKA